MRTWEFLHSCRHLLRQLFLSIPGTGERTGLVFTFHLICKRKKTSFYTSPCELQISYILPTPLLHLSCTSLLISASPTVPGIHPSLASQWNDSILLCLAHALSWDAIYPWNLDTSTEIRTKTLLFGQGTGRGMGVGRFCSYLSQPVWQYLVFV